MLPQLTLTYEQACLALAAIVDERGEDYVYDTPSIGCAYFEFDDSSTLASEQQWISSCVVGCVIEREAPAVKYVIAREEELNAETNVDGLISDGWIVADDPRTRVLLWTAQNRQDMRRPYGEVLRHALIASEHADLIDAGVYR